MKTSKLFIPALAIISNALILFLALINNQNLNDVLWVYWAQGIIMTVFSYRRIKRLTRYDTEGIKTNLSANPKPEELKNQMAVVLLIVVLFFHFVYAMFLLILGSVSHHAASTSCISFVSGALMFTLYHYYQSKKIEEADKNRMVSLKTIPLYIFLRLLPIHFTLMAMVFLLIICNGWLTPALIFFVVLKTLIEANPDYIINKAMIFQQKKQQALTNQDRQREE